MSQDMIIATCWREGRWWIGDVDGVGATHARSLAKLRPMVANMAALMLERDVQPSEITLLPRAKSAAELEAAREQTRAAEAAAADARRATATAVRKLYAEGLTLKDIAELAGLSFQRVHQIVRG